MPRRPSTQTDAGLVDNYIGTAFDDVKVVADNMDAVLLAVASVDVVLASVTEIEDAISSITPASLDSAGVVQLNDSIESTSITEAATPNAVNQVKNLINVAHDVYGGTF